MALLLLVTFSGGLLWLVPDDAQPHSTAWDIQVADATTHQLFDMLIATLTETNSSALPAKEQERRVAALNREIRRRAMDVSRPLSRDDGPCHRVSQYYFDRICAER